MTVSGPSVQISGWWVPFDRFLASLSPAISALASVALSLVVWLDSITPLLLAQLASVTHLLQLLHAGVA